MNKQRKDVSNTLEFTVRYNNSKTVSEFVEKLRRLRYIVDVTVENNEKDKSMLVVAQTKNRKKLKACRSITLLANELKVYVSCNITTRARMVVINQLRYVEEKAKRAKLLAKQVKVMRLSNVITGAKKKVVQREQTPVKVSETVQNKPIKLSFRQRLLALFTGQIK